VVLSDEKTSSKRIEKFATGEARWMVAVRMVSEGVDVPRLAVGVYATTIATPLFFSQAVGRFVRARARGETASVFLPSSLSLLGFAAELELERDHVLGRTIHDEADIFAAENALLAQAQAGEAASEAELGKFEALGSQATFAHVLYDGAEFGHAGEVHVGSEEEMDFLGIPGLLEPDQVRSLLQHRQKQRRDLQRDAPVAVEAERDVAAHERLAMLRRELNGLVAAWNHRNGTPHGVTHAMLRKECGGPAAAVATAGQLQERIDRLREMAARKSG
jgi:superfamily II DNA or RNA helicase